MSQEFYRLLEVATVASLKNVLRTINLQTSGTKAVLKLRVEDAVQSYTEDEFQNLIPHFTSKGEEKTAESSNENVSEQEEDLATLNSDIDEELNLLRDACKKKEEIILLKRKLKELQIEEASPSPKPQIANNFKDMEDLLCPFSGDDNFPIDRWVEHFDEYAEILCLDDRTKFIFGKRLLSGTARLFVRSLKLANWMELKHALVDEFKRLVTKADIFSELNGRKKRRDETVQQYVLSMQEIASHNPIEEEDLIQFIIKGIADTEINKSMLYNANNIDELKHALRKYEKFKNNTRDNFLAKPSTSQAYNRNKHQTNPHRPRERPTEREANAIPANSSHQRKEFTCFKCGRRGHIAKNCSSNEPVLTLQQQREYKRSSDQYQRFGPGAK